MCNLKAAENDQEYSIPQDIDIGTTGFEMVRIVWISGSIFSSKYMPTIAIFYGSSVLPAR
jgi:hypothetical protein